MNTELQTQRNTSQMTPIEIALQTDENGWVSSKRLYEFLELHSAHYAEWCKDNIIDNPSFVKDVDYEVFTVKGETPRRPSKHRIYGYKRCC